MLLSHIVEEVMNSRGAAAGPVPRVKAGRGTGSTIHSSKIKFNVQSVAGKVHKSKLLICMDCGEGK